MVVIKGSNSCLTVAASPDPPEQTGRGSAGEVKHQRSIDHRWSDAAPGMAMEFWRHVGSRAAPGKYLGRRSYGSGFSSRAGWQARGEQ